MERRSSSKRWLKLFLVLGGAIFILFGSLTNNASEKVVVDAAKNKFLTVEDVTRTIERGGLALTPDPAVQPSVYKIGNIEPSIYQFKKAEGELFIYRFASIDERNTQYREWVEEGRRNKTNPVMFSAEFPYNQSFAARNTIIVYALNPFPKNEEYAMKISPTILQLGKTIFYRLNGGQQVVFRGEGKSWQGQVILNYYDYFWTDERGVIQYNGWNHEQPVLKFKGDPSTIAGEFRYQFKSTSRSFGGAYSDGFETRRFVADDRPQNYGAVILGFGGIDGSGAKQPVDGTIVVTLQWNDKEETFELKAMSEFDKLRFMK